MKHLALSASNVPRGLYCHVKLRKLRQCVTNYVFILQDSIGRIVDELGNRLDMPLTCIVEREHSHIPTKNTDTYHYGYS